MGPFQRTYLIVDTPTEMNEILDLDANNLIHGLNIHFSMVYVIDMKRIKRGREFGPTVRMIKFICALRSKFHQFWEFDPPRTKSIFGWRTKFQGTMELDPPRKN